MFHQSCLRIFVIIITSSLVISCSKSEVYYNHSNIDNEIWEADNIIAFPIEIKDTISNHNIIINIRNTTNYPNCNLFLFVNTTSPNGNTQRDTIEVFLADDKGNWLGKGVGKIRDYQFYYQQNIRFPQAGVYKVDIQQAMRTEKLEGVRDVGIAVEKIKTN